MNLVEKLEQAKELIIEVETELLETKGLCPYEFGYTLQNLNDTIEFVKTNCAED